MKGLQPIRLAGYQGGASILTAALTSLARNLDGGGVCIPHLQSDVTAYGESATSLFRSVENGERHIAYMASGYLSARVPELMVLDLPFTIRDRGAALAALDGEAGRVLREAVAARSNYHVLAFWDNGFRHISNAVRPIRHPSDCEGLVIRTLDSEVYRATLASLGFRPVTTDVMDLVRVVQEGTVHAQENPLTNLLSFELWRFHSHVTLTGHFFGVLLLVCQKQWYESLSPGQREELQHAVDDATAQQRRAAREQDHIALDRLRRHGVQLVAPDAVDHAAMRACTEAVRRRYAARLPASLLQAYTGCPDPDTVFASG
jgi:TRAP-type C4-dicarboxylate transport system substrate-binding protein